MVYIDDDHWRWMHATIDSYKPIGETDKEWLACPLCGVRPRVWLFNNGEHAKCCCGDIYDGAEARCDGALETFHKTGRHDQHDFDALRRAWNEHVRGLES